MSHLGGSQNYGAFWIPSIIRHLIFRVPQRDHNFDNHPFRVQGRGCMSSRTWNIGFAGPGSGASGFKLNDQTPRL